MGVGWICSCSYTLGKRELKMLGMIEGRFEWEHCHHPNPIIHIYLILSPLLPLSVLTDTNSLKLLVNSLASYLHAKYV